MSETRDERFKRRIGELRAETETIVQLDARIAANREPAHRYPNTRRRPDVIRVDDEVLVWEPRGGRVSPLDVRAPARDDALARMKREDRRALALVALIVLVVLALIALAPWGLDFTHHHTCPARATSAQCKILHTPQDLRPQR